MFGNTLGWGISGGLVLAFIGALLMFRGLGNPTDPTDYITTPAHLAAGDLDTSVVRKPSANCDAGDKYREALKEYAAHPSDYLKATSKTAADLKGVKLVVDAVDCSRATLFASHLDEVISYEGNREDGINHLGLIGGVIERLALDQKSKNKPDVARKYFEAEFALGANMYNERLVFAEMVKGLELMLSSSQMLQSMESDAGHKDQIGAFRSKALEYNAKEKSFTTFTYVAGPDESYTAAHAGDTFYYATHSKVDRMWRVEAILKLGRFRFEAPTAGDQLSANRVLRTLSSESDPAIAAAVKAAQALTPAGKRMWDPSPK